MGGLGSTWASRKPTETQFEPISGQLGPNLRRICDQVGLNLEPTAAQQRAESAVRNQCSKSLFETAPGQTRQRTCPTSCSSRAATVDRSIIIIISRSTTYSSPDDSFERWVELRCGCGPLVRAGSRWFALVRAESRSRFARHPLTYGSRAC